MFTHLQCCKFLSFGCGLIFLGGHIYTDYESHLKLHTSLSKKALLFQGCVKSNRRIYPLDMRLFPESFKGAVYTGCLSTFGVNTHISDIWCRLIGLHDNCIAVMFWVKLVVYVTYHTNIGIITDAISLAVFGMHICSGLICWYFVSITSHCQTIW